MYEAGIEAFLAIIEARSLKKAGEMLGLPLSVLKSRLKYARNSVREQLKQYNQL